jgi:hypothetical protein
MLAVMSLLIKKPEDNMNDPFVMAFDYVKYRLGVDKIEWYECPDLPDTTEEQHAMRKLAMRFEQQNTTTMAEMAMALCMNSNTLYSDYQEIIKQLFPDDNITWRRCVALYSFTGLVAVNCMNEDKSDLVRELTFFLGIYTRERIDPWIRQRKNGWREILLQVNNDENECTYNFIR